MSTGNRQVVTIGPQELRPQTKIGLEQGGRSVERVKANESFQGGPGLAEN